MLKTIIAIGIGGFTGAVLRYVTTLAFNRYFPLLQFPLATLVVNVSGCLLMGILFAYGLRGSWINNNLKMGLIVGFCGAFTTFSAFTIENYHLIQEGKWVFGGLYISLSVVLCLFAFIAGVYLFQK
jgi:fluoride exporter